MRISPISSNYYGVRKTNCNQKKVQFQGKHDCAKFFGSVAAGLGTLGALGGIAIMTGGVSLIPTLAYGALCGGIGAAGGHLIDKAQPDYNKKKK
jgi:hypothetical protein